MATYRVKHASVFANGAKVGTMNTNDIEVNSGDEIQFGDEGFAGWSDGATTTSCDVGEFVPIQGTTFNWAQAVLNKQVLNMSFAVVNAGIWEIDMRATSQGIKSDAKAGTQMSSTKLTGGAPKIVAGF
jgi:hypothetical protein